MKPNWNITPEEQQIVRKIARRANEMLPNCDKTSLTMDIVATHNHACRLRLADLLAADDFNFAHDVAGIGRYLDRENLVLADGFWPRFAAPDNKQLK